jgi:hypothetical protein
VNPPARGLDVIPILLEADWGLIQLPADVYPREVAGLLLEQVAEQTEEFHRHGYDVVVIGRRAGLDEALASAGVPHLERINPSSARALQSFLRRRPPPRAAASPKRKARSQARAAVKNA